MVTIIIKNEDGTLQEVKCESYLFIGRDGKKVTSAVQGSVGQIFDLLITQSEKIEKKNLR